MRNQELCIIFDTKHRARSRGIEEKMRGIEKTPVVLLLLFHFFAGKNAIYDPTRFLRFIFIHTIKYIFYVSCLKAHSLFGWLNHRMADLLALLCKRIFISRMEPCLGHSRPFWYAKIPCCTINVLLVNTGPRHTFEVFQSRVIWIWMRVQAFFSLFLFIA